MEFASQPAKEKNDENFISGSATQLDCKNVALWSADQGTHLAGLGLENIIAVVIGDAVLVADASRSQDISKVVDDLERNNVSQATLHAKHSRPWGWFENLVEMPGYKVKRLHVQPGASLSLQSHQYPSEHWVVVSGTATVVVGEDSFEVLKNASVYISSGKRHRLANDLEVPLVIIEVQTGSYLGEDDIVRYSDVYNRTSVD